MSAKNNLLEKGSGNAIVIFIKPSPKWSSLIEGTAVKEIQFSSQINHEIVQVLSLMFFWPLIGDQQLLKLDMEF